MTGRGGVRESGAWAMPHGPEEERVGVSVGVGVGVGVSVGVGVLATVGVDVDSVVPFCGSRQPHASTATTTSALCFTTA